MRNRKWKVWHISVLVALILAVHWLGTNVLAQRFCLLSNSLRAQSLASTSASTSVPNYQHDDGWRRTDHGWERIERLAPTIQPTIATHHLSLAQLWPAAWAIGMLVLMCSVPGGRSRGTREGEAEERWEQGQA